MSTPNSNTVSHTIVLKPGESFSLPAGAEVIYVSSNSLDSTCPIPAAEAKECYYFQLVIDNDNNDGHPLDEGSTYFSDLIVGGVTYELDILVDQLSPVLESALINALPQTLIEITDVTKNDLAKRTEVLINFKLAPSLAEDTELKITAPGFAGGLFIRPNPTSC